MHAKNRFVLSKSHCVEVPYSVLAVNKCVNVHCSNYPAYFFTSPVSIGRLDIIGATPGAQNSFCACHGRVAVYNVKYLQGLMYCIAEEGFKHHVSIAHGKCVDILKDAVHK